jgi:hypothetical protein
VKNPNYNPHPSHCCAKHGCKYGDPDCPVESGEQKQDHPCEQCGEEEFAVVLSHKIYPGTGGESFKVVKAFYGYMAVERAEKFATPSRIEHADCVENLHIQVDIDCEEMDSLRHGKIG